MRMKKTVRTIIALLGLLISGANVGGQQNATVARLIVELKDVKTTSRATGELSKLGHVDAAARQELALRLPNLIDAGPSHDQDANDQVWKNEVSLAGALKLAETASSLAKWIGITTPEAAVGGFTSASRLTHSPAGRALISIGDPSVPALQALFKQENVKIRWSATYALLQIGTPKAMAALRAAGLEESDASLASFIQKNTSEKE
jgi:hypothetical protein